MNSTHNYIPYSSFNTSNVSFTLGPDRNGKPQIHAMYEGGTGIAMVTPPCVTNWPRVSGDGNFGTLFGPADPLKAKFTLDITDAAINGTENGAYTVFNSVLETIDEQLLAFVYANQLRILGRKNLGRDELKMLQIPSSRPKYDKVSGASLGKNMNLSVQKYAGDGMGGKAQRTITVCDKDGKTITSGVVCPGDVVAATIYINQVYSGVGGDKFGIHWAFEDVQVICQRTSMSCKTDVPAFQALSYDFAQPYIEPPSMQSQFSEPMYGTVHG